MAKNYRTDLFKGPLMRVSYAFNLFTTREKTSDGGAVRKVYECTLIAPKAADWSPITGAIREAVIGQWGEKAVERLKNGVIRNPILDGAGKEARNKEGELHPGMGEDVQFIRVQANEEFQPFVYNPSMTKCSRLTEGGHLFSLLKSEDCPSGSWGYPLLNVFAWSNPKNGDGVSVGIHSFQLTKIATGDDVLGGNGGRVDPNRFFEAVKGADGPAPAGGAASMFD
jgi:hypothetical protein